MRLLRQQAEHPDLEEGILLFLSVKMYFERPRALDLGLHQG
jgi:hypothetical protein